MSAARNPSYTLIVFGGRVYDVALATDFVMMSKKFMEDGLNPTFLSGTHLSGITNMVGPLFFGREDLRERARIYDSQEAANPFYHLVGPEGLKLRILSWIQNVSSHLRPGDRIIIIFMAHGEPRHADVQLFSRRGTEFLTRTEVTAALSTLPNEIRILLINEACFSSRWMTVASDVGTGRDVMVETAATVGQRAYNYRSASGKFRCSLFAAAFIEELQTYPEGHIRHHHTRIQEMKHVASNQDSCSPLMHCSPRALQSNNVTNFVLAPAIAKAIENVVSDEDRHQNLLRSRMNDRIFWARMRRLARPGAGASNDGDSNSSNSIYMRVVVINSYLDDLGSSAAEGNRSTLATACQLAVEGQGRSGDVLKRRVIRTIAWQEGQMLRVGAVLDDLTAHELIARSIYAQDAAKGVKDHEETVLAIFDKLRHVPEITALYGPIEEDGYIGIFYEDAHVWLTDAIAYNQLLWPSTLNLDNVKAHITSYFRASPVEEFVGWDVEEP